MPLQRLTKQKQIIRDLLMAQKTHLTGDQLYEIIKAHGYKIGRATVFRNLKQLVSSNEIGYIPVVDGAAYFDFCKHQHYHFKCTVCKQLFDTPVEYQTQLDHLLPDFKIAGHALIFYGVCPTCNNH